MLRPGRYKSEHDGNVFQAYRYVMEVKETAKSYIFKLLEAESNIHTYRWYTDKEHRKPYYKRDYVLVTITDPVAQQLEKLIALVSKRH